MENRESLSEKRLIIDGVVNGKTAYFLLDTGASVGLIDSKQAKKYKLARGRRFNGTLVGAGGEIRNSYMCDTFAYINGKPVAQFVLTSLTDVRESIREETGYEILGIIGLPQMKLANITLDLNDNMIVFEK